MKGRWRQERKSKRPRNDILGVRVSCVTKSKSESEKEMCYVLYERGRRRLRHLCYDISYKTQVLETQFSLRILSL